MNYIRNILPAMLLLFSPSLWAQSKYNYALAHDYSLTIHGGSNLHDWTETVGKSDGIGAVYWNDNGSFDLNGLKLIIEANSITSTEGSVMNDKTYKALKTGKYPAITFMLTSPVKSVQSDGKKYQVEASGTLTIAGVTKPVVLHATVTADTHGKITFEGSQPIKMSDFGIDPPTALFGMLKVTNDITVQFKTSFHTYNN